MWRMGLIFGLVDLILGVESVGCKQQKQDEFNVSDLIGFPIS